VRASLIEHNHELGLHVSASDAVLEAVVVRDTLPHAPDQTAGRGINIQPTRDTGARSSVLVRASLIDRNHELGVFVAGSDAKFEAVVVRDTLPQASDQQHGRGISIQGNPETGFRSSAVLRAALIEHNHEFGLAILDSDATVESTLVRDTLPRQSDGLFGDGVVVASVVSSASAHVSNCRVQGSARAGLAAWGSPITLGQSIFECNHIDLNGETYEGTASSFEDLGGNACGCMGETFTCAVQSAGLEPPEFEPF
jgi:hypothetical protein